MYSEGLLFEVKYPGEMFRFVQSFCNGIRTGESPTNFCACYFKLINHFISAICMSWRSLVVGRDLLCGYPKIYRFQDRLTERAGGSRVLTSEKCTIDDDLGLIVWGLDQYDNGKKMTV